jgi:DNA-binding CsgD family transcriptional regulator
MTAEYHIVIAENSLIVRRGIAEIIRRIENCVIHEISGDIAKIRREIEKVNSSILFVGESICQTDEDFFVKQKQKNKKNVLCIILLSNQNQAIHPDFEQISIHLTDRETENKITQILNRFTKEKSSENTGISVREKEIISHVALGKSNKQIADELFISIHTVVTHRKNIVRKLGIKTVSGLTVYAILNNLISLSDIDN